MVARVVRGLMHVDACGLREVGLGAGGEITRGRCVGNA
jgi:hypothetical protein